MKGVVFLTCLYLLCRLSLPVSALNSLLVFGDSYLDTGNVLKLFHFPQAPYGETFPGNSSGRLSNGVVFTDIIAEYLQIKPGPTPFTSLSLGPAPPSGVNFAVAGSGIIAGSPITNLARQVDSFELLVKSGAIPSAQLASSLVVLSVGGNDYIAALTNNTVLDAAFVSKFAPHILNGTETQLKRIFALGATNFVMLNLPPAQCAPRATATVNGGMCLPLQFIDLAFHNEGYKLIRQHLTSVGANATLLDLYDASLYIIQNPACFGFNTPSVLTPCCASPKQSACGEFNQTTSAPLFTVCPDPSTSFFWDGLHPTQAGWKAISSLFFYANNFSSPGPHLCESLRIPCPPPPSSSQASNVADVPISGYCPAPFLEGGGGPAPSPSAGGTTEPSLASSPQAGEVNAPPPASKGFASATPGMLLLLLALFAHLFL